METLYLVLLIGSSLIALGVIVGLFTSRIGLSHMLVFLVVGMLAGVDGPLGLRFADYPLAFGVGNLALAMILLDGGVRTPLSTVRRALLPAGLLATVGVVITSAVTGAAAMAALDMDWRYGLLLGAVVSSTDAGAVFGQLRHSGVRLPPRLAATIEVESGFNDPMAVFLTLTMMALIATPDAGGAEALALLARQVGWGVTLGLGAGWLAAAGLDRLPIGHGHFGLSALLLGMAGLMLFGLAGLLDGSGFLAVYLFGLVAAARAPRVVQQALGALDGYAWAAHAGLFLLLGLLVTPHEVWRLAGPSLAVAAALMLVGRPLAVVACLTPLGFGWRAQALASWVGLRGAVPIVLSVYPVLAGLEGAWRFFDVAFVVVLTSLILQGPSVGWVARRLGLDGRQAAGRHMTGPAAVAA